MQYNWAGNSFKLQRAIVQAGKEATEEQIKAVYVSLGGQVIESDDKSTHTEAPKPAKKKRASSRR